jgi:hypothetical protein
MAALASLDPDLARDLLATGRAAWQVLAGAVSAGGRAAGQVLYADAPFGVGYFVTVLEPESTNADFRAGGSGQRSGELVADGTVLPPGDGGGGR